MHAHDVQDVYVRPPGSREPEEERSLLQYGATVLNCNSDGTEMSGPIRKLAEGIHA